MSNSLLLLVIGAGGMFCAAAMLFLLESRLKRSKSVTQRLDEEIKPGGVSREHRNSANLAWAYRLLQQSGFDQRPGYLVLVPIASMLICYAAFHSMGILGLVTALGGISLGIYLLILWRAAATRKKMLEQLPGFIDLIIRTMGIGRSFDSALLQAIEASPEPLSKALEIVKTESSLGGSLTDALHDAAQIYRLKEMHMLTLALRVNQRYGGSIKAMLENIITMIRRREHAERELRALTGETRLSAWLLGTMPAAMAGYMMIVNPSYIGYLVDDPNGTTIIATALGLQVVGGLLLWRMMRSIR